jgi:spore germination protein GerM
MTTRWAVVAGGGLVVLVIAALVLVLNLQRRQGKSQQSGPTPTAAAAAAPQDRMIKARLFYVSEDGRKLASLERDVRYAERPVDQARELIEAQLEPPDDPVVSAIPKGTRLRALFLTKEGEAFVDLSGEISSAHGGGALDELLTIYTIVHALTANMPAITAVQVLVDGKEVDTLAGHVDLRRPLLKNLAWVQ